RAVAERPTFRTLATAEVDRARGRRLVLHRREARSLVRAVAERLLLAQAAGAPPVRSSLLHLDGVRRLLRHHRFRHLPPFLPTSAGLKSRRTRKPAAPHVREKRVRAQRPRPG